MRVLLADWLAIEATTIVPSNMNLQAVRIIWFAMLMSHIILVAACFFLAGIELNRIDFSAIAPKEVDVAGMIWLMAFATLGAAQLVPRLLPKVSASEQVLTSCSPGGEQVLTSCVAAGQTPWLLSLSCMEACTMLGLVSAIFVHTPATPQWITLPAVAAIGMTLGRFPTESLMRRYARVSE
jgi:hypothetical protein